MGDKNKSATSDTKSSDRSKDILGLINAGRPEVVKDYITRNGPNVGNFREWAASEAERERRKGTRKPKRNPGRGSKGRKSGGR